MTEKNKTTSADAAQTITWSYDRIQTYVVAALFAAGNIALPQLCHLVHMGGPIWLPIYFFTLVGAYRYGWRVGLLVAAASPMANMALFGMPEPIALPGIMFKSVLLALFAYWAAIQTNNRVSLWVLAVVVLAYQVVGTLGEWLLTGNFFTAVQDFRIGVPGLLLQVFGGYLLLRCLPKRA